jgi:UTP:GlnB (protein PII) uridylyltransferase
MPRLLYKIRIALHLKTNRQHSSLRITILISISAISGAAGQFHRSAECIELKKRIAQQVNSSIDPAKKIPQAARCPDHL